jgi:REP element-mobilizing transposase RayT
MSPRRSHTNLIAHAIWAIKKREPMLQVSIDERLASFLRAKAIESECELVAVGNANDHVEVLLHDPSGWRLPSGVF